MIAKSERRLTFLAFILPHRKRILQQSFYCSNGLLEVRGVRHLWEILHICNFVFGIHNKNRAHIQLELFDKYAIVLAERT